MVRARRTVPISPVPPPAFPAVICSIDLPATPEVTDPCGEGNAAWIKPADTELVTWTWGENGSLIATAAAGYGFGEQKAPTVTFPAPTEINVEACPTEPPTEEPTEPPTTEEPTTPAPTEEPTTEQPSAPAARRSAGRAPSSRCRTR